MDDIDAFVEGSIVCVALSQEWSVRPLLKFHRAQIGGSDPVPTCPSQARELLGDSQHQSAKSQEKEGQPFKAVNQCEHHFEVFQQESQQVRSPAQEERSISQQVEKWGKLEEQERQQPAHVDDSVDERHFFNANGFLESQFKFDR